MPKRLPVFIRYKKSIFALIGLWFFFSPVPVLAADPNRITELPAPRTEGSVSVEKAIRRRRSIRSFSSEHLSLEQLGQLLWAAQGMTSPQGQRSAPSAGGLYPLELFVVAGRIEGLKPGIYHYETTSHSLTLIEPGDFRSALSSAALGQEWVAEGSAVLVFAGIYERTMHKYGKRGRRYVHIETGHAAQNVYLQAASLELGTVMVGAFDDQEVQKILGMDNAEKPLALMPVGHISPEDKEMH